MKGTFITSTPRASVHTLAVQGILVCECHTQIVDIVRSRCGEAHVLLFAEPVFDPDRGVVDWYTPVQGKPVTLASLDADTRQRVRQRFSAMAEDIRACVKPLRATGDHRRALAGDILELALRYPDEAALYLVGEQPVVTSWGCGPAQAGVEPQDLTRLGALAPPPPAPQPPTPPPPPNRTGGSIVPWLVALCLLLAIAGLGYALHAGLMPDLLARLGLHTPAVTAQAPGGPAPEALDAANAQADALRKEIDTLKGQVAERRAQCKPEALAVPPEAPQSGDLSFLEGDWVCDTGLADSNNRPVVVTYAFKADGTGGISIQGSEGVCTASARTRIDTHGALTIVTDEEIPCPGGVSYRGQEVTCTGVGGQTRCEGRNVPGMNTWEAGFYRK